ncbi:MAG: tetratricopeptide repeat protein [Limisphaerales bacterium]
MPALERKHGPSMAIVLFVLVAWTFLPTLGNDLISYDDMPLIAAAHRGLSPAGLRWALTAVVIGNWQPLTCLSHLIDCAIYGDAPWGHHLTNLLWHAANTVLVFLLLLKMTGALKRSWIAAALFGLHPLRVESVAWVAERKDVLSGFFWLLTLWSYLRYTEKSKFKNSFYALSIVLFTLGLMCKPMLVTLPCVMLLLDYWPLARWKSAARAQLLLEKLPFFVLSAASSLMTLRWQSGAMMPLAQLSIWVRCENAAVAYCRYVAELFWPQPLVFPRGPAEAASAWVVTVAFTLLIAVTAAVVLARRRGYLFTGWCWYLGTLVPVIGLVQVGGQAMADRYAYLPSLGLVLLLVWAAHDLTRPWRWQAQFASAALILLLTASIAQTRWQIHFWKNSHTLFSHAVEVDPDSLAANWLLAFDDEQHDRLEEAAKLWQRIVTLVPFNAVARDSFGSLLLRLGRPDDAVGQFRMAARLQPSDSAAEDELGIALAQAGHWDEAIAHFQRSLKLDPNNANAKLNFRHALDSKPTPPAPRGSAPIPNRSP